MGREIRQIVREAVFSDCGYYRYSLSRTWEPDRPKVMFVGLNPSTADAEKDDPTIRRCMGYARDWGYGGVLVLNLFAYRATDPRDLLRARLPVGEKNDHYLAYSQRGAELVIAAWGNHGTHMNRARMVVPLFKRLYYLRLNASGEPAHPLYLPGNLKPRPID